MKQLPVLLLFVCGIARGQVSITAAVDTSLYVGIENLVTIQSSTIPLNELKLISSAGTVKGKNGSYIVECTGKEKNILLEAHYKNKVVSSKKLAVHFISDPNACLLGKKVFTDSVITKKELSSIKLLMVKINYPLANLSVASFTVEIIHNGRRSGTLQQNGKEISKEMKIFLQQSVTGDYIIFHAITVASPGARRRFVPSLKFRII